MDKIIGGETVRLNCRAAVVHCFLWGEGQGGRREAGEQEEGRGQWEGRRGRKEGRGEEGEG